MTTAQLRSGQRRLRCSQLQDFYSPIHRNNTSRPEVDNSALKFRSATQSPPLAWRWHDNGVNERVPTVSVRLWRADAIVLVDWLVHTDLDTVPVTHPAQKQALADLLTRFEWAADEDVTSATAEEIAAAQAELVRDMGW